MSMQVARDSALLGTCSRLAVGAALVRYGYVLATGWNGGPVPCYHPDNNPCRQATHAEVRVLGAAARHGVMTEGCELYVTHSPCLACAQLILQCGIIHVYWDELYRDSAGADLLIRAGRAS